MTPQEVTRILQDPHAVPDSDDEEDQAQWKVRLLRQLVQQLMLLPLTGIMYFSVGSWEGPPSCNVLLPHEVSACFHMYIYWPMYRLNRL